MRQTGLPLTAFFVVFLLTTLPFCLTGWNWSDASTVYHFGQQFLLGRKPYVDVVYQIGPVPTWIEASIQMATHGGWPASVAIGVGMKAVLLLLAWAWLRDMAGTIAATVLASALSCAWLHPFHSSWMYADVATVAILVLFRTERTVTWFLCGLILGLLLWSRQSAGMLLTAALITVALLRDRSMAGLRQAVRNILLTSSGIVLVSGIIAGLLAMNDALLPTITGTFLTGAERKCYSTITVALDALSCGTLANDGPMNLRDYTLIILYAASLACCAMLIHHMTRASIPERLILILTGFMAAGLVLFPDNFILMQHIDPTWGSFTWETTRNSVGIWLGYLLPFSFCLACWGYACAVPDRWNRHSRIPATAILISMPLLLAGGVMAHQVSGLQTDYLAAPTWRINPLLIAGVLWLFCGFVPDLKKSALIIAGGSIAPVILLFALGHEQSAWFPDAEQVSDQQHPLTGNVVIHEEKKRFLTRISHFVKPGDTLFIAGTMPVLYDLLGAANPTRLDTIYPDFSTDSEVRDACKTLLRNPPRWILSTNGIAQLKLPAQFDPEEMEQPITMHYYKRLSPLWWTLDQLEKRQYEKRETFTPNDSYQTRGFDRLSLTLYELKP